MADTNNNGVQDEQNNRSTDSNLPILFANGYPTSLEKMSCEQLELFIPFLVKCSRYGGDDDDNSIPKWWPNYVDFRIPLEKQKNSKKNWEKILKKIVEVCYEYHKQPFLLKYSRDLCENEPANLRYVKASDSTTSLFSRHPKKLLLTFRNENMLYDKKKRMTLWKKNETPASETEQDEIESTFDIMLCDYCDAEFYSDEAYVKHEKKCSTKTELQNPIADNIESIELSSDEEEENEMEAESCESFTGQNDFMAYFALRGANCETPPRRNNSYVERSLSPKKKKKSLRARRIILKREKDLERAIPFSSPAGILLTTKSVVNEEYNRESVREIESDCGARPNTKLLRVKHRLLAGPENAVIREMRKIRHYYWPKRHFKSMSARTNFEFLNRKSIEELQPCSVIMEKLHSTTIQEIQNRFKIIREEKERARIADSIDLCSDSDEEGNPEELVRMFYQGSMFGIPFPSQQSIEMLKPPQLPFANKSYFTQSESITTSYQQLAYTSTSTSNTVIKSSQSSETSGKIQQWIQSVSTENYNISNNQVTVINTT